MAWVDLASNQMPTFTDAQSGGFTLNSGQSSVTSNECMTKSQALTKYNLNSSNMSAYASNQLVPKSTWVSGVSYDLYNANQYACGGGIVGTAVVALPSGTTVEYSKYYYSYVDVGTYAYVITSSASSGLGLILTNDPQTTLFNACNIAL